MLRLLTICCALVLAMPAAAQDFLIIAHRGASGELPEHTLAAYERAIDQGADYIEPDLVATKDGVLVARHENEISGTTDVVDRPEFAARQATKLIDGHEITGWFTEDFTLAELRTLRARERAPELRPGNTAYDGLYQVPTLAEIITLVKAKEAETGHVTGLFPEIKHPSYFAAIGHDLAALLVNELHGAGYRGQSAPVIIQSFEVGPLVRLNAMTDLRIAQLLGAQGGPADIPKRTYVDMLGPEGLAMIATYADGIGADIRLLLDDAGSSTGLTESAQTAGLQVIGWTLRKERAFVPEWAAGCEGRVLAALQEAGADGVFADDPGRAIAFRQTGGETMCAAMERARNLPPLSWR